MSRNRFFIRSSALLVGLLASWLLVAFSVAQRVSDPAGATYVIGYRQALAQLTAWRHGMPDGWKQLPETAVQW